MAILLNIDTAVDAASVCLSRDNEVMTVLVNEKQKDQGAWLHSAIHDLVRNAGLVMKDVNAVATTIGPGSYTGLRIGLATAKGLCYALGIPLICVNTLQMMAHAARDGSEKLICPLIDARRMEVFTAIYNNSLEEIIKPFATVIVKDSFTDLLNTNKIIFCGNGVKKTRDILCHTNAIFSNVVASAANLPDLSSAYFKRNEFADIAYVEPLYIKEFFSRVH